MVIFDEENQKRKTVKSWQDTLKDEERVEVLKRRVQVIKDISINSMMDVIEDKRTHTFAAGIGLMQGLKYGGSLSRGIKGGLAAYGVMIGATIIHDVIQNRDVIRKA